MSGADLCRGDVAGRPLFESWPPPNDSVGSRAASDARGPELPDLRESPALSFSRDSRFLALSAGQTTRVFSTASLAGVSGERDLQSVAGASTQTADVPEPEARAAFTYDVYLSYAHLDNVELVEGKQGWVAELSRALQARLAQLLRREVRIWMDLKLQGNDLGSDRTLEALQRQRLCSCRSSHKPMSTQSGPYGK
jgi:hypothetical protein